MHLVPGQDVAGTQMDNGLHDDRERASSCLAHELGRSATSAALLSHLLPILYTHRSNPRTRPLPLSLSSALLTQAPSSFLS